VDFGMSSEVAAFCKSAGTEIACEWLLSSVPPKVNLQSTSPHECLWTEFTFERSFAGVSSKMISKVTMSCEHSPTVLKMADKRLFAIVDSHMCL
jgi:hypothetical protein